MKKIAVIGAGGWGLALGLLLHEKNNKVTYVTLVGLEKAQEEVAKLSQEALDLLEELPVQREFLRETIIYLIHREK